MEEERKRTSFGILDPVRLKEGQKRGLLGVAQFLLFSGLDMGVLSLQVDPYGSYKTCMSRTTGREEQIVVI